VPCDAVQGELTEASADRGADQALDSLHSRSMTGSQRCTHVKAPKTCWRYAWKSPPAVLELPEPEGAAAELVDDWASAAGARASAERAAAVYFIFG